MQTFGLGFGSFWRSETRRWRLLGAAGLSVGPQKFQSGTAPQQEGGRAVVHRAQFTSLSEAKYIADEIARLAAT
jgi:hypothetical protein